MSDRIAEFERQCAEAHLSPTAVLTAAGIHKNSWWKWKRGDVSPTLRSFEAAEQALNELRSRRVAA